LIFSLLIVFSILLPVTATTQWYSSVQEDTDFNWKAEIADLRSLEGPEKYDFGIGGANIEGGNIEARIKYDPGEFDFFQDSSLYGNIRVEGDIFIEMHTVSDALDGDDWETYINSTDNEGMLEYHLLVLPISFDSEPFFEFLFDHLDFLAHLTSTTNTSYVISGGTATYTGNFRGTHNVTLQWETATGLLKEKEVVSQSGKMLRVVQGQGETRAYPLPVFPVLLAFLVLGLMVRKRRYS
jgi:hypothetical protein